MDTFVQKVHKDIKEEGLLHQGDTVVVGVSGGADSVGLLLVLLELQALLQLKLAVVHVNHGLRGDEAAADELFVKKLCEERAIPCTCFHGNIKELVQTQHLSEEEAGRLYRYQCFEEVRKTIGGNKIAVAHHREDMAETVLMHLFRGSGIRGLAGIPVSRGFIIRPLLKRSREEIEEFLVRSKVVYRTDATNFQADYTRNKIRLELMPYVQTHINSSVSAHVAESAWLAADVCRYMEKEAKRVSLGVVRFKGNECCELQGDSFVAIDVALQRELLRQVLEQLAGSMKDIGLIHIEDLRKLFEKSVGRSLDLPYGLQALRTYDGVLIKKKERATVRVDESGKTGIFSGNSDDAIEVLLEENAEGNAFWTMGELPLTDGKYSLKLTLRDMEKNLQIPKNRCTKWFDYAIVKDRLVLRHRKEGDYMVIVGGCKKSLRRILMDDKIAKEQRDELVLLAEGSHVLWILDTGRMSESYKIIDGTQKILMAELIR